MTRGCLRAARECACACVCVVYVPLLAISKRASPSPQETPLAKKKQDSVAEAKKTRRRCPLSFFHPFRRLRPQISIEGVPNGGHPVNVCTVEDFSSPLPLSRFPTRRDKFAFLRDCLPVQTPMYYFRFFIVSAEPRAPTQQPPPSSSVTDLSQFCPDHLLSFAYTHARTRKKKGSFHTQPHITSPKEKS